MDETLSRGFSGFVYNGSSCCIKTACTLDLLRNMVEEEDKVFYIYPAVGSLRRDAHADHYEIGSSLGQWCNSFQLFDNSIGPSSRAMFRSACESWTIGRV